MSYRPLKHLPPHVAEIVLRAVAPHVLPLWSGNCRVRVIPPQASWSGRLSGLPIFNSLDNLLKAVTGPKARGGPVVFTNPDQIGITKIDRILRENKAARLVYVVT